MKYICWITEKQWDLLLPYQISFLINEKIAKQGYNHIWFKGKLCITIHKKLKGYKIIDLRKCGVSLNKMTKKYYKTIERE